MKRAVEQGGHRGRVAEVFLDLRVKVNADWRDNDRALDDIGVPKSTRRERQLRR